MNTTPTSTVPGYGPSESGSSSQFQFEYDSPRVSFPSPSTGQSATGKSRLAGGRQITRNRASYSCHICRRRKVKCDKVCAGVILGAKVHPVCGNCVKNGTECVYDAALQKNAASRSSRDKSVRGVKRRREKSQPWDQDLDPLQMIDGQLKQAENPEGQRIGSQAIEARLDKLTSMIERLSKTDQPRDQRETQLWEQRARVEAVNRELRPDKGAIPRPSADSSSDSPRRAVESSSDEFPIPAGCATDLVDPVGSLNLGHLSLENGGRSRYVGTTYWAYISHEINELNQLLRDQNRSPNEVPRNDRCPDGIVKTPSVQWKDPLSTGSPRDATEDRSSRLETFQKSIWFPSSESPSAKDKVVEPEMLDNMPTKRQSHILYKGFMSGVHAISPVVHPPTIHKLYNAFWEWYDYRNDSGEPCPDPSFIPLLYAIWYGGSVTVSIRTIKAEFNVSSRSTLLKTYNDEVTRWLDRISFPRSPSLQGLAAYLLLHTILSREEEPLTSSLFTSVSMRVAQTMGLHRDPAKFGIEPCEAEYRRRIWWHIVHMDGVVAMSSGLPPLVSDEKYWDVQETSEVKDTLLGTPEAEQYHRLVTAGLRPRDNPDDPTICGGPSMVNVYYLSARGKYVMVRAVRRILKIQLGTQPVTRMDMEELRSILVDLQLNLNSIVNRIPEAKNKEIYSVASNRSRSLSSRSSVEVGSSETELPGEGPDSCPEQYHSPVLVSFHKWARILLSLFIDKAFCVAYQPFLKNAKSRIWPTARQSALRHCHGFMEKFISLTTDPDFQPFQWSWPGNHQPMHATMIMLIDLYERPYSSEASKSRAFIDKVFSLSGPDGGVVGGEDGVTTQRPLKDGGREAWDMIRRLRQQAWQKAGLDPQKLWTEQAQIQAGVPSTPTEYSSASSTQAPAITPLNSRKQLSDFSKMFYNMTRSHVLSPATRPSSLRYQLPPPVRTIPSTTSQINPLPRFPVSSTTPNPPVIPPLTTPEILAPPNPFAQPAIPPPSSLPYMDTTFPITGAVAAPTPPSMVDPNVNFDWDQWDAVFGQHLPVADELMELDPVAGFEFGDLPDAADVGGDAAGMGGGDTGMMGAKDPEWFSYC
ncbi:putative C6 transcription factor [Aspergillus clavatus NRRL 1]|uniref:C6 transcription factor, putative n=1 Tax=Aspergillus clavatus (strain ATCC 1007 / CBS 513.65 / DSM 816 / NCTC 3887 / NRRL 1 / QM 1276 / 107) TaxID=344612 RepID=A1CNE0_ASPCL|nr:C6 transcription factor, putative [Aspergillus clavatus NRRL 1]EAW07161.1 C6 transcription factor, putative [Aspergillus clavatus NRRL 1]